MGEQNFYCISQQIIILLNHCEILLDGGKDKNHCSVPAESSLANLYSRYDAD